eukprot:525614-Heterocapsa_arctica.AAC.1
MAAFREGGAGRAPRAARGAAHRGARRPHAPHRRRAGSGRPLGDARRAGRPPRCQGSGDPGGRAVGGWGRRAGHATAR